MQRLLIVCAVIAALAASSPGLAQYGDVRDAFLASNPSNGWEYGFIDEEGSFVAYNTTFDDGNGIAGWCLDNTPGPMGDITINYSQLPIDRYGVHWEPGQVCVRPPAEGSSVIRWHAPDQATVRIEVFLENQNPASDTQLAVEVDGTNVIDGQIGGSAQEPGTAGTASPSSLQSEQASDELSRAVTASVEDGSTVSFSITVGEGQEPGHISTALQVNAAGQGGVPLSKSSVGVKSPSKLADYFGGFSRPSFSMFQTIGRS